MAGTAALLVLLRRRLGKVEDAQTLRSALLAVVAGIPLAVVSFATWWVLDDVLGRSFAGFVSVSAALAAGGAAYAFSCRLLGVRELNTLLSLRVRAPARLARRGLVRCSGPHPQLLDHRAHRPREIDPGRPHPRADRHRLRP